MSVGKMMAWLGPSATATGAVLADLSSLMKIVYGANLACLIGTGQRLVAAGNGYPEGGHQ